MKLSKKMPKAQTKFIVKIVLLIFTISTLLFPQNQMNSLKAKLKEQAGKKTIVVKVYAPSDEDAYLYRLFLFTWSTQNGYDEPDEDTDGLGNYTFTLYKPSKEELEQRRINAEKKAKLKANKEANEREKIFAEDPIAAFSYAIYTSDFEMFKKYYYPYKELVKKERIELAKVYIEKIKTYKEEKERERAALNISLYKFEKSMNIYQEEKDYREKIIAAGDTNVFYYIEKIEYDDSVKYYRTINFASYKEYNSKNNSFNKDIYHSPIINLLWKSNDKFFYDAIEFLEKDGTLLWEYVYLLNLPPFSSEKIKHEDVDKLCYAIKKMRSIFWLARENDYRNGNDFRHRIPEIFLETFSICESEDDALKIYNAFLYWYEKYKNWTDKNIPNYKGSLDAAFEYIKTKDDKILEILNDLSKKYY